MLIQKGANVNTNVITIVRPPNSDNEEAEEVKSKWKLLSTKIPPPKSTCEPVFKVIYYIFFYLIIYLIFTLLPF